MTGKPPDEIFEFIELGWMRWPSRLGRLSPALGRAVADGDYLAAWPRIGASILPFSLVIGLLIGLTRFGYPSPDALFVVASLPALTVLVVLSQHGAGLGFASLFGFVIGDLTRTYFSPEHGGKLLAVVGSAALAGAVLSILLVAIPRATRTLSRAITPTTAGGSARTLRVSLTHAALQLIFVYLWCQIAPMLLQSAWLWRGIGSPPVGTMIAEARAGGWGLAILAAYAGAMRVVFESSAGASRLVRDRAARRDAALASANGGATSLVMAMAQAAFLTLLLSSFAANLVVALAVFAGLAVILTFSGLVLTRSALADRIRKTSPGLRLLVALGLIGAGAFAVEKLSAKATTFTPLLSWLVATVALTAILFPAASPARRQPSAVKARLAAGS